MHFLFSNSYSKTANVVPVIITTRYPGNRNISYDYILMKTLNYIVVSFFSIAKLNLYKFTHWFRYLLICYQSVEYGGSRSPITTNLCSFKKKKLSIKFCDVIGVVYYPALKNLMTAEKLWLTVKPKKRGENREKYKK